MLPARLIWSAHDVDAFDLRKRHHDLLDHILRDSHCTLRSIEPHLARVLYLGLEIPVGAVTSTSTFELSQVLRVLEEVRLRAKALLLASLMLRTLGGERVPVEDEEHLQVILHNCCIANKRQV